MPKQHFPKEQKPNMWGSSLASDQQNGPSLVLYTELKSVSSFCFREDSVCSHCKDTIFNTDFQRFIPTLYHLKEIGIYRIYSMHYLSIFTAHLGSIGCLSQPNALLLLRALQTLLESILQPTYMMRQKVGTGTERSTREQGDSIEQHDSPWSQVSLVLLHLRFCRPYGKEKMKSCSICLQGSLHRASLRVGGAAWHEAVKHWLWGVTSGWQSLASLAEQRQALTFQQNTAGRAVWGEWQKHRLVVFDVMDKGEPAEVWKENVQYSVTEDTG